MDNQNELMHYGILGMKWGIRRFQNEDGTLTDAGKKRKKGFFEKYQHKEAKNMSMDDLNKKINRYRKENEYTDLAKQRSNPKTYAVEKFLKKSAGTIATAAIVVSLSNVGRDWVTKILTGGK